MKEVGLPVFHTDFIVIGTGVAGLRAAIELARFGEVLILAKDELKESATERAQGGVAVALSDEDRVGFHLQDTLLAGDGLCSEEAVSHLVAQGKGYVNELIAWGAEFDRIGSKLSFTREGAHRKNRVLHAQGDSTGKEIVRTLLLKAWALDRISLLPHAFTTDLILGEDGRCLGTEVLLQNKGERRCLFGKSTLLATGGLGRLYLETTNPPPATGDGFAVAYRAGAELRDMEFIQFHPTSLFLPDTPRFLLSEAIRGEGGVLRNEKGERFVTRYHPLGELAPRDIVARAIVEEMSLTASPCVYLDLRDLDSTFVRDRFPRIYKTCLHYGVDITSDLIPVHPSAHYAMGGVKVDLDGRTSIPGLFAAGEAASTGVHGANRLASNSLLEGLVFGGLAGKAMGEESEPRSWMPTEYARPAAEPNDDEKVYGHSLDTVRRTVWKQVGIIRTGDALQKAAHEIDHLLADLPGRPATRVGMEIQNMVQTAKLIASGAAARMESRGGHFRSDFPFKNDARFKAHTIQRAEESWFETVS